MYRYIKPHINITLHQLLTSLSQRLKMRNTTDSDFSSLPCIYVLSTGRCGTKTLAALFNLSHQALALHEPRPLLYGLSKLCYQGFSSSNDFELLKETFLTCRSDLFRYAFSINKTYLETSPQTTFLAPILIDALNNVKFIHVTRDPKSFVRSGMRRGWYQNHAMDNTRIVPHPDSAACISWPEFSHFDKILWLWRETNTWIHDFLKRIDPQRYFFCRAEDLFSMNQVVLEYVI